MIIIKEDSFTGGIKIITSDATFRIYAELEYDSDHGHGGGAFVDRVVLKVVEEEG